MSNCPWSNYVYTFTIIVGRMSNSFLMGMVSPSLVDLTYQLKTTIATISFVYLFMSFGYLFGALMGFSLKYLNRQIVFIALTVISMFCTPLIPLVSTVWSLFLCAFLINMGWAVLECGSTLWMIEMWPKDYSSIMYLTKSFYSIGLLIAPVLVAPFIEGDITKFSPELSSLNQTTRDSINYSIDRTPKLVIPFSIGGSIIAIIPTVLFIMYFIKKYKKTEENYEIIEECSSINLLIKSTRLKISLIILMCISSCFMSGLIKAHLAFGPTYYQFSSMGISAVKASYIMSVVSAFMTIGRVVAVFESMKLSVDSMIVFHLILGFFAQILLYFGETSETITWIANAIHGFAYSSLYTSFILLAEKYLKLNETIAAFLVLPDDAMKMTFPFLIGPVIEKYPRSLLHFELTFWFICSITILIAFLIIKIKR